MRILRRRARGRSPARPLLPPGPTEDPAGAAPRTSTAHLDLRFARDCAHDDGISPRSTPCDEYLRNRLHARLRAWWAKLVIDDDELGLPRRVSTGPSAPLAALIFGTFERSGLGLRGTAIDATTRSPRHCRELPRSTLAEDGAAADPARFCDTVATDLYPGLHETAELRENRGVSNKSTPGLNADGIACGTGGLFMNVLAHIGPAPNRSAGAER